MRTLFNNAAYLVTALCLAACGSGQDSAIQTTGSESEQAAPDYLSELTNCMNARLPFDIMSYDGPERGLWSLVYSPAEETFSASFQVSVKGLEGEFYPIAIGNTPDWYIAVSAGGNDLNGHKILYTSEESIETINDYLPYPYRIYDVRSITRDEEPATGRDFSQIAAVAATCWNEGKANYFANLSGPTR